MTAYLYWKGESLAESEAAAEAAFEASAGTISRSLLDVRNAQTAYVAAGQSSEFWAKRSAGSLGKAQSALASLRAAARAPEAQSGLDRAGSILRDLTQLDKRIGSFARNGQLLMAADLIFADGYDLLDSALARVEQAVELERAERRDAAAIFARRQLFALAAAAAAALLTAMLLAPVPTHAPILGAPQWTAPAQPPLSQARPSPALELDLDGWSPPTRETRTPDVGEEGPRVDTSRAPQAPDEASAAQPAGEPALELPLDPKAVPTAAAVAPPDFGDLARLCTDLACVVDTRALPGLLERTASILGASGIILWIADPDGRELNPIFAQGYPPQLVNRLGTIGRDAENATAAAFRTCLVQTVDADATSDGAIAAPLVTPAGCVGVMAAEVTHAREQTHDALAAAAIVAAQLATLVGPPSARRSEAAGA
ncbi:MAG TPA: GAF domain-containing protein [Vicinamibacterales bacterium]|nr:GAF domain-containing protein [Vicinamibacterales bacterium]